MEDQEEIYEDEEMEEQEPTPPQYYADYDVDGNLSGFYVDEIHGENIPEKAIPITEEEWQACLSEPGKYKVDNGTIREKTQEELDEEAANIPPAPPSLDDRVEDLETESINTMIGLTEVYESTAIKDAERETENVNTMIALTEVYELVATQQATIADQQSTIDSLTARLDALEGGEG